MLRHFCPVASSWLIIFSDIYDLPSLSQWLSSCIITGLFLPEEGALTKIFSIMNFKEIGNDDRIEVFCKYDTKIVRVNYYHSYISGLKMVHRGQYGIGVTFNEPSQSAAIAAFLTLGLIAIPVGNGIYRLFKKKEE